MTEGSEDESTSQRDGKAECALFCLIRVICIICGRRGFIGEIILFICVI
jgi:hypothetical protein